jgi:transposase
MMLNLEGRPIWLYAPQLDFRKQINGLIQVVISQMGQRPNDGGIYLFRNRQRTKLKVLMWDRNGFILCYKRLEKGKFDIPVDLTGAIELSWEQIMMLISGMPIVHIGKYIEKELCFS